MSRRSSLRPLALLLVLSLLALIPVGASAQTREDVERADAARDDALATLRSLDARLDRAIARYQDVNGELEALSFEVALLVDRIREHEREATTLRREAQNVVIAAYTSGGREHLGIALTAGTIQDIQTSRVILDRAAGTGRASVGRLEAVRTRLAALKEELMADQQRVSVLRAAAEEAVLALDELQRDAAAAHAVAAEHAAAELRAYEQEQARLRAEEERRAALFAALARGAAAGVDETITPGFLCPVAGARFINDWGFPRSGGRSHQGTDMFALRGTPIQAVADGRLSLDVLELGGIVARVHADHGVTYYFAHLDGYAPGITEGALVSGGDVIGYVGNTGNALGTSPHLHIQIHPAGGAPVNPYQTLRRHC